MLKIHYWFRLGRPWLNLPFRAAIYEYCQASHSDCFVTVLTWFFLCVVFTCNGQFVLFLIRRESGFWTLSGFGPVLCLSETANIMEITAALYSISFSFVLWLFIVYQLSRFLFVKQLILHHSLIVGLWAAVIYVYSYLLLPSFTLLACHHFNGGDVLFVNAAITCFGSEHWPWGTLALCVLIFVAIPIPVILLTKKSSPRIKPLVDVYLSYVKDDRDWFIAFNMARRIVLCMTSVFIASSTTRQVALAFVMQLYLFGHFIIQPYRTKVDNIWEAIFLGFASFFAIISILPVAADPRLEMLLRAVYFTPVVMAYVYGMYHKWREILTLLEYFLTGLLFPFVVLYHCWKGTPIRKISFLPRPEDAIDLNSPLLVQSPEDSVERAKSVYHLRDDLLVDMFSDENMSTSD